MSIEVDWTLLDEPLREKTESVLRSALASVESPPFLGPLFLEGLSLGKAAPQIEMIGIEAVDPGLFGSAYAEADAPAMSSFIDEDKFQKVSDWIQHVDAQEEAPRGPGALEPLQVTFNVEYRGDACASMSTTLDVNYPVDAFLSLPVSVGVTHLELSATVVVAVDLARRMIHFTIINPEKPRDAPDALEYRETFVKLVPDAAGPQTSEDEPRARGGSSVASRALPLSIVPQFETSIGDADRHALRNVRRVERFITETLRAAVVSEFVSPSYQTIVW